MPNEKSYAVAVFTVTVVDCTAVPDAPEHESVYVLETLGETDTLPASSFAPDHPSDALHDVEFVDDHVIVTD